MDFNVILALVVNLAYIQGKITSQVGPDIDEHTHFDVYASAISRAHYNPWACDYRSEPGYKCLSCNKALHCYPGNFALLVQCAGMFPHCRNGYCSRYKVGGCIEESDGHTVTHNPMPPYVQIFHKDNKTSIASGAPGSTETPHTTELNEPVPEQSASSTITTELNYPNKIDGEFGTSTSSNSTAAATSEAVEKPNSLGRFI